jgi:tRNA G18 (ribose-2'-O)-methylase SpoU
VEVVSVEQHKKAISYSAHKVNRDVAFIFGNEIEGVPEAISECADVVVHIPMHGLKESLNVSTAAGIILFNAVSTR